MNEDRFILTKRAGILGVIGNIFLLIIKAIIGFTFKSQAMIADAFNSAGDIFASLMTFIGNRIASEPNDEDHNFGHGKAEYIFSMFIAISMIFIAGKLFYDAVCTLILGSTLQFSWFLILVCIITIITKLALFLYTKYIYKQYNNIGISLWIGYTGITILLESYNVLMDISIDEKTRDLILDIINSFKDVKKIDSISSSPVGAQHIVFITICLDGNLSTFDSHSLANTIEESVSLLDNVYKTIIHVEPI